MALMKRYEKSSATQCAACEFEGKNSASLKTHIQIAHRMSGKEYTIKYLLGGIAPQCPVCKKEPRYVAYGFKEFCKEHRGYAESKGGRKGGAAPAWNKGKTALTDDRVASIAKKLTGELNPFYGKTHTDDSKKKIADSKRLPFDEVVRRINEAQPNVKMLSDATAYETNSSPLKISCTICGTEQSASYWELLQRWMCRACNPRASRQQLEIIDFIRDLLKIDHTSSRVVISTRSVISPLEIDVWIPEKSLGIEYHGLFWHSGGKSELYDNAVHRKKFLACSEKNIRLLQFYGDEWRDRREICESIIINALGMNTQKLNARDCVVKRVDVSVTKPFLESNHLAGSALASHHYALTTRAGDVVGVLTLRKPNNRIKRYTGMLEIARMAFLKRTTIRGGASKLLKAVINDVKDACDGILSYADLRFGTGAMYESVGFKRYEDSVTNYWYTDGATRISRSKVTAENGVSEIEVATSRGLRQIHGCGNAVYILEKSGLASYDIVVEEQVKVKRIGVSGAQVIVELDNHACKECSHSCKNRRAVGIHVNKHHSMTLEKYVLKHFYRGVTPKCGCGCGDDVAWHKTKNCFNKFVNGHNAS